MINILSRLTLAFFETVLLYFCFDNLMIERGDRKRESKFMFFIYFIFQSITYLIDFPFFSTSYYYIAFSLFIAMRYYHNQVRIKLIISSLFVTLNYASKLLSAIIVTMLTAGFLPTNPFHYVLDIKTQALACLIILVSISIIILLRKTTLSFVKYLVNVLIFTLPLINLFVSMQILRHIDTTIIYYNVAFLLFAYSFFLFVIIDQIIHSSQVELTADVMGERLQMQSVYYKDIENYNHEMSRVRHEIKNHLTNVLALLIKDDTESAKTYISSITKEVLDVTPVINTGNSVVDVIFNSKVKKANDLNIKCKNDIVVPPTLKIDTVDLSVILSNLLDNSIEACQQIPDKRFINAKIMIYKESLFIEIANNFNGHVIKDDNNQFLSTKSSTFEHGIGLGNVIQVVKKYNGSFNVTHENHIFCITIIIPSAYQKSDDSKI